MVAFSARMFLAATSAGVAVSVLYNLFEIFRYIPGASGCFGRQKNRKRHERADAADHDPEGAHDCLQFETYGLGQAAPVSIHAATSAPASFCVPGAGFRPGPGAHAHPTR